MWTKLFWMRTLERTLRTGAQAGLAYFAAGNATNAFTVDWKGAIGVILFAMVLSVLTCIAASGVGDDKDPGVVK